MPSITKSVKEVRQQARLSTPVLGSTSKEIKKCWGFGLVKAKEQNFG